MLARLPVLPRYDIRRAARALGALLRDPDDLPQVFTLIRSMSGTAPHRLLRKWKRTETGRRVLKDRPDITKLLADRSVLRAMPVGSLGRAYLAFVERENISAEGIRAASQDDDSAFSDPDFRFMDDRMRDTHDLWHAATGYQGDVLGELSLLAFSVAQNWHGAVALIIFAGVLKGFSHGSGGTQVIFDGYRRGKKAVFMPSQDWESLLPLQVEEVRARLNLEDTPKYEPVRTSQLREMGVI